MLNGPLLVPFRVKATIIYTDYWGSTPQPQAVGRGGGGQFRTPKLSLAHTGEGRGASSAIVIISPLFLKLVASLRI